MRPTPSLPARVFYLAIACFLGLVQPGAQGGQREAATSLRVPQVPGSFGYTMTRVFPDLVFPSAVGLATPPHETNRLFVMERLGRVTVVTNLAAPTRSVFLDLTRVVRLDNFNEMGLLGLAFHPKYSENGRFFLFYTATASNTRQNRLSEFRVQAGNPHAADPASEKILIQQRDDAVNHNAGDLHFGPDGYLYVALGDEGGANDQFRNSQRITNDFFAGILRLDVDQRPGSLPPNPHAAVLGHYRVPPDNPYVGATTFLQRAVDPARVRTEFWAVGLRNPWRMAFDSATGELWVGDVGQDARETVAVSRSGANHGWAFREAEIAGPMAGAPADFLTNPIHGYVPPLHSYLHRATGGFSVTGGRVYRGSRLAQLFGAYVFADYVTGNVWSLVRPPGGGPPVVTRLVGYANIAGFGVDPRNGDLLAVNHASGHLVRLDYSEGFSGAAIPDKLSDTGAFRDVRSLDPQPGVMPYEINLAFWSDGASKQRWFSIPELKDTATYQTWGQWITPPGTVWIKHFEIDMVAGDSASRRRLETRFLVRNSSGVHGFTYRWNASRTDATLVAEAGEEESLDIRDVGGNTRSQRWRYPGRAECLTCHNPAAGGSLSFTTAQLNGTGPFPHHQGQIGALAEAGYFAPGQSPDLKAPAPALVPPSDQESSLTWRARSWLDVNCAYCHRPGGPGGALFDTRLQTPFEFAGLIRGSLNSALEPDRRVVVPGSIPLSELHTRLVQRGARQMPPLATSIADPEGSALIQQWIREEAADNSFDTWTEAFLGGPAPIDLSREADPDRDGRSNFEEYLHRSSPVHQDLPWRLTIENATGGRLRLKFFWPANRRVILLSSESLDDPQWKEEPLASHGWRYPLSGTDFVLEQPAPSRTKFYRTVVSTP